MGKYVLTVLKPQEVRAQWADIDRLLKPVEAHCHGELLVEDILLLVENGAAFVMALFKGDEMILAGAFEVIPYPRKKVLNAIMVGGEGASMTLTQNKDQFSKIARRLGCSAIRGYVRPSMVRLLQRADPTTRVIYCVTEQDV
jgi:hypothetical protein